MKSSWSSGFLVSFFLLSLVPDPATGQPDGPLFAMHVKSHATKAALICTTESPSDKTQGPAIPCTDYNASGPLLTVLDLYVVIARADSNGVSGTSFGLFYDDEPGSGIRVYSWNTCVSGLEFLSDNPVWPASGSGARLTWLLPDDCQNQIIGDDGVHAVAGAFYVYAYSNRWFEIIPNRTLLSGAELAITNCLGEEAQFDTTLDGWWTRSSHAAFGTGPGCDVCVSGCHPPDVEPSTWGQLKKRYR